MDISTDDAVLLLHPTTSDSEAKIYLLQEPGDYVSISVYTIYNIVYATLCLTSVSPVSISGDA